MRKHSVKDWLIATRPWSFPASAMPVVATLAYLYWMQYQINWINGIGALVNIVLFHAAGNTWSDYFDYKQGVDTPDTFGAKTLTGGLFSPRQIRNLSLGLLAVAGILGLVLVWRTGWPLLWIGLGGAACALLYPPLKFRALGDLVIALAYAWLPTWGTSYVAAGVIDWRVLFIAVPLGLITVAILHANNTRDIKTDTQARIITLAMKTKQKGAIAVYMLEILIPFVWVLFCIWAGYFPGWTALVLLVLPFALSNVRTMLGSFREGMAVIANLDEKTAGLQLLFSLALTVSFIISGIWR